MQPDFIQFARAHGLVIKDLRPDGRIHRVPTEDKPHHKNGAYRFRGGWGWVQNWGHMLEPDMWAGVVPEGQKWEPIRISDDYQRGSRLATEIVSSCQFGTHPYMVAKGFPDERVLLDAEGRMIVPMRDLIDYKRINSVQRIEADGSKKFLAGGKAKGSVMRLGTGPELWLVEGYATGLSVRRGLKSLFRPATVVVCFSAMNLGFVASLVGVCRVVADNDQSDTGARVARESGKRWVMPDEVGTDANDFEMAHGTRALAELLREAI